MFVANSENQQNETMEMCTVQAPPCDCGDVTQEMIHVPADCPENITASN